MMNFLRRPLSRFWVDGRRACSSQAKDLRIGLVGVGNVGAAVAGNLGRAGASLVAAFDVDAARLTRLPPSVHRAQSAAEVASFSDVVLTVLPTPAHVLGAMSGPGGVLAGLSPGSVWVDHSTTDYEQTRALAKAVEAAGSEALEAPVTGGMALLHQGQMTALCGGKRATFDRVRPLIRHSCAHVLYLGEIGAATVTKIVSNMLAAAHNVVMGEALMMAKRSNVDLSAFFDAIRLSAGNSFVFETEAPLVFNGTFDPEFTIGLHCKDLGLGYDIARRTGAPIPVHALVEALYRTAMAKYGKEVGSSTPPRLLEDATGVELRAPGFADWTYSLHEVPGGSVGVGHTTKTALRETGKAGEE